MARKYTRRRPYSKLGGGGVSKGLYAGGGSKTAVTTRTSTRYTRKGPAGSTGFMPGDFTGRDVATVVPATITVNNAGAIVVAANAPTKAQGTVLTVTGVETQPQPHNPTITQTVNNVILTGTVAITVTGRLPAITQDNPNQTVLNPDYRTLTVSALNPQVFAPTTLTFDTVTPLQIGVRNPEIVPGVTGIKTLSQADIQAVWKGIQIDGMTPYDIMKYMAAIIIGRVEGGNTGTEKFKAPVTGVERYRSHTDSNGNRQTIELL